MSGQNGRKILRNTARRLFSVVAFHCWVRPRSKRTIKTKLLGFSLVIPPTVFHPRYYFTSRFMAEFLRRQDFKSKSVLDLGSGSGILSLAAAAAGGHVTSIDINPSAVAATSQNAHTNELNERISARQGDLFESLEVEDDGFDYIISNPPYYPGDPLSMTERAFMGGAGNRFMSNLASALPRFLRPRGLLLIVISSDVDAETLLGPFTNNGYSVKIVEIKELAFETLSIVQIQRDTSNNLG